MQSGAPSIQGEVENAIQSFTGEKTRIRGASRTDSGVHARGQVVDFLTRSSYTADTFIKALNWYLPPDIKIRGAGHTSLSFHSRKDALSRVYRYTLLNARWPSALLRDFSHWVLSPLNLDRMRMAAADLPGTHDFSALTVTLPSGRDSVRRVDRWDVWRDGDLVLIEAEASGFLRHQILRTNGILVDIGLGRTCVEVLKGIIDGTIRELKHWPSPPARGLCLMSVKYPNFPSGVDKGHETA